MFNSKYSEGLFGSINVKVVDPYNSQMPKEPQIAVFKINEEFKRCTVVPLEPAFMSLLDRYSPELLEMSTVKRGAAGQME